MAYRIQMKKQTIKEYRSVQKGGDYSSTHSLYIEQKCISID